MPQIFDLTPQSAFQLFVRQALIAAQHGTRQVGLLLVHVDVESSIIGYNAETQEQLICQAWIRIRSSLRESDAIFRTEEGALAVLLASIAGANDAILVAKKILRQFEQPILWNGSKIALRIRIGIALFPEQSRNAIALIKHAGDALKTAKRSGEGFALYSEIAKPRPGGLLRMSELRQAIVQDQLFLLYQPKVRLRDGSILGIEALARWKHPHLGVIEPNDFIPVAEQTGLIIPLTLWVLHRALLQCRAWKELGIDLSLAINLSMLNLTAAELPEQIAALLKDAAIPSERLELEITESVIMDDPERTLRTLRQIRSLGVRLAIDDFGTGYSSLAHLSRLPVTTIKIDKSFIREMEATKDNAVIVRSIIDLAHNLDLQVVAEGVESVAAKEMLVAFGCDEAQGYYFSPPVPAPHIQRFFGNSQKPMRQLFNNEELAEPSSLTHDLE
jgi:EAL domain-containing protein (putative c-di-GMP-specific phosphodiesterase class I)/GGDEF domain-containing protein